MQSSLSLFHFSVQSVPFLSDNTTSKVFTTFLITGFKRILNNEWALSLFVYITATSLATKLTRHFYSLSQYSQALLKKLSIFFIIIWLLFYSGKSTISILFIFYVCTLFFQCPLASQHKRFLLFFWIQKIMDLLLLIICEKYFVNCYV